MTTTFNDGDRIEHAEKGLGTVTKRQTEEDFVVDPRITDMSSDDTVLVRWDDDRFPVGPVAKSEIDHVRDLAAAISSGDTD